MVGYHPRDEEDVVPLTSRLQMIRTGFAKEFWVANVLELFERFAYYASKAVLAVYVAEQVGLGPEKAGWLVGSLFNTLLYFLPPLAGTIVDRYGFKRSLSICFAIFSLGYFLIGLAGVPAGRPLVDLLGPQTYMIMALVVTAIGGSLIKPSVVGTVARTTTPETNSLGYSIYYTLVNIGGAIGPLLAVPVRENVGIAYVLMMSSATSFLLLVSHAAVLPGAGTAGRSPAGQVDGPRPRRHGQGVRRRAIHGLPRDLLRVLGDVLADLLFAAVLRARRAALPAFRGHRDGRRVDDHLRHRARGGVREDGSALSAR